MRLDHISYAATHDQIVDVVQRLGSRIGSAFTDGGIHPRFGTRNFTLPLKNGLYLEVVCPLDHPAADTSPFGKFVSDRANEGGGWLSWVVSTEDISSTEKRLGRLSVTGHRKRPDGTDLLWKQLGVLDSLSDPQLPFFIEWLSPDHPSKDGNASATISAIEIAGSESKLKSWLGLDNLDFLQDVDVVWSNSESNMGENGLISVTFETLAGKVTLN